MNDDTPRNPEVIVFDVNETLSDLSPLASRFADIGAPTQLAATWFASVLRDGFALTAAGATARFADLGAAVLATMLHGVSLDRSLDDATRHLLGGFTELSVHPDVVDGVRALAANGQRLATLSNGAASVAEGLLERAGIATVFERLLSVEDAGVWKPAAGAYRYAAQQLDVHPTQMMLVAVHPWDIDGAQRAGLQGAWVNRDGGPYPSTFTAPDLTVDSLTELAGAISPA